MKIIRAVLIDDEPDAIQALRTLLEKYCEGVEVVGTAPSALKGLQVIQSVQPDLVFLDIEMPHGGGFDLLEGLGEHSMQVIFVTAYNRYAVKAIRASAMDYLLKPVDLDELMEAVNRARKLVHKIADPGVLATNLKAGKIEKLTIPTRDGYRYLAKDQIVRLEAEGSYTRIIVLNSAPLVVSRGLKEYATLLEADGFVRVHNSHLVNIHQVEAFSRSDGGFLLMADGSKVNIARSKKELVLEMLNNR